MTSASSLDHPAAQQAPHGAGARRSVRAQPAGPVRLFEQHPELRGALAELPDAEAQAAEALLAGSWRLGPGRWDPPDNPPLEAADCGYLLLEGLLLCRVRVGPRWAAQLLGRGDVFRADDPDTHGYASVASEESFRVLEPAHIAVLECGLMAKAEGVPGTAARLQRSWSQRERSLSVRLAIVQVPRLTTRLELLLWHLADRFGRRRPDGVLIPIRLSHEVLAECCSARRTSVLAAVHELEESGAVRSDEQGYWLLGEGPPREFA